jgi:hypothetical protein
MNGSPIVNSAVRFIEYLVRMFVETVSGIVNEALVAVLSLILGTLVLLILVLALAFGGTVIETLRRMVQRDGSQPPPVRGMVALAVGLGLALAVGQVLLEASMSVSPLVFPGAIIVGVGEALLGLAAVVWIVVSRYESRPAHKFADTETTDGDES